MERANNAHAVPHFTDVLENNPYVSHQHYDNVKKWIGQGVSRFLSSQHNPDVNLFPSDQDIKDIVWTIPEIKTFSSTFDQNGTAFDAFWGLDQKVHGKSLVGRDLGGLQIWKKKHGDQVGQWSTRAVSLTCNYAY